MTSVGAVRQLAACALVLAMAVSTPVIGWGEMARHSGHPLHPLFDHSHHHNVADEHTATGHEARGHPLTDHTDEDWIASQHGVSGPVNAGQGTTWTASTAFGSAGWMAGVQILPPSLPPVFTPEVGSHVALDVFRLTQFWAAPTSPPPRRAS